MPRSRKPEPPIYTFRVRILDGPYPPPDEQEIWREIQVAANQTLEDLGYAIPDAFDFDDPHLWSFFLSGKPWDRTTEYALDTTPDPWGGEAPKAAGRLRIRDVPLRGKKGNREFLFIFDYGDEWHFGVKFMRADDAVEPGASYPRVAASQGAAPPQYPEIEDEWDEEDKWDEEEDEEALDEVPAVFRTEPVTPEPPIYTFRARLLRGPLIGPDKRLKEIWRVIEIAASQRLADLATAIAHAFDFESDYLWSFFLSGRAWDEETEYAMGTEADPLGLEQHGRAHGLLIRDLPLPGATGKKEFLFLFDYADEWHFGVKFLDTSDTLEPDATYPRVVGSNGEAPSQYPLLALFEDVDDWDEEDEDVLQDDEL